MWKNVLLIGLLLGILGVANLPIAYAARAGGVSPTIPPEETYTFDEKTNELKPITEAAAPSGNTVRIQNPIGTNTFGELVVNIARAVTGIALVLATLAIIIVGFKFVLASVSGDAAKLQEAKKLLMWVLIGTAIIVAAAQLAGGIVEFVKQL